MSKFASLTSGLLARKGAAEPASLLHVDSPLARVDACGPDLRALSAFGRRPVVSEPPPWPAREAEVRIVAPTRPAPVPAPACPADAMDRAAVHACPDGSADPERLFHVSLRLRRRRFVKLKLAAALLRRPTLDIVSEALDQWFDGLPPGMLGDCPCIRGR